MATASWLEKSVSKARKAQQIPKTHTHTYTAVCVVEQVVINMQKGLCLLPQGGGGSPGVCVTIKKANNMVNS